MILRYSQALNSIAAVLCLLLPAPATGADSPALTVTISARSKPISPDLFGVFFEDINYAADGGLYAELVQNRSFEYQPTEQLSWNPLTSWQVTSRGGGKGSVDVEDADPVHPNNPNYAVLHVSEPGEAVGLANGGFDGIPITAGENYKVSLFAKQLYLGARWSANPQSGTPSRLMVRLENKSGQALGESALEAPGWEWKRLEATIRADQADPAARLVVLTTSRGGVAFDVVSLFPEKTFRGRANGLRADLAQAIADLQPKFIRFPGGCLAHGNGLGNMYRWKDTIGPVEQRRGQANIWGYHQSVGLGYFEYFQFCEDIGATPLPVVPAGVSCQNSGQTSGTGQRGLPMDQMPAYVQEVLDLIEWANGPATSTWGAKRAAAGHPAPFKLKYLGVGNEDHITPVFRERFQLIYDALKQRHPEITVIGTVGPFHSGKDFDAGWKIAHELELPMVDEHYYEKPDWFLNNLQRYDTYDRSKSLVYLGEYAAHDEGRVNTLRSALAEAAYLTSLERNGDVVRLASYAPLLAREGHTQWRPDMIYFDNTRLLLTANYYAHQMFTTNSGHAFLPVQISGPGAGTGLAISCVQSSSDGDVILKVVNPGPTATTLRITLDPALKVKPEVRCTLLTGDARSANTMAEPHRILPVASKLTVQELNHYPVPAHSVTVLRMSSR